MTAIVSSTGCSRQDKRRWQYRSLEQALRAALPEDLKNSDADQRREAVAWLAEGNQYARESVFYTLEAVARTDPVTQIRCIAVRGLARYDDARPVGTMLTILQAGEGSKQTLPANADLRWEVMRALVGLDRKKVLDEQQRGTLRDLCIRLTEMDTPRNIRLVALEALGRFHDRAVFPPLIRALRDKDFAIADQAEDTLIALTGVTQSYDADAWEAWLAKADNPFEHAGRVPQTTRPAGPSWWDQQKRAWRRGLKLGSGD